MVFDLMSFYHRLELVALSLNLILLFCHGFYHTVELLDLRPRLFQPLLFSRLLCLQLGLKLGYYQVPLRYTRLCVTAYSPKIACYLGLRYT